MTVLEGSSRYIFYFVLIVESKGYCFKSSPYDSIENVEVGLYFDNFCAFILEESAPTNVHAC